MGELGCETVVSGDDANLTRREEDRLALEATCRWGGGSKLSGAGRGGRWGGVRFSEDQLRGMNEKTECWGFLFGGPCLAFMGGP